MTAKKSQAASAWSSEGTGCPTGKRSWTSRAGAKSHAALIARQGSPGMRPYLCPHCALWHIGHKPRAVMRGRATANEWYGRT